MGALRETGAPFFFGGGIGVLAVAWHGAWLIASLAIAAWCISILWRMFSTDDLGPVVSDPLRRRLSRPPTVWIAALIIALLVGLCLWGAFDRAAQLVRLA